MSLKTDIICKRCLIDTDTFVRGHIEKQLGDIPQAERSADGEFNKRLLVCDSCGCLMGATCSACGSFAVVRAARAASQCPKEYW